MKGIDVDAPHGCFPNPETMDVVANGRERADSPGSHSFVARFPNVKGFLRRIILRLAHDFEVAKLYLTFKREGANAGVRIIMWRQEGAWFHSPLNDKEG